MYSCVSCINLVARLFLNTEGNMNSCNLNNSAADGVHDNNVKTYAFGNFQDTRNWIECESISYPGRKYFFNLRTLCSTWTRPVSKHVPLQSYSTKSRIYCNESPSEVDDLLMVVSSETEDDNDDDCFDGNNGSTSANTETTFYAGTNRKNMEIFSRLYSGVDMGNCCNDNRDKYLDKNFNYFANNICPKNFDTHGPHDFQFSEDSPKERNDTKEMEILRSTSPACINDFLEIKLLTPKDQLISEKKNEQPTINGDRCGRKKFVTHATSSDEENGNDATKHYCVPRLREIKPYCLTKKSIRKERRNTITDNRRSLREQKLKTSKIICEMYGVTTINHNTIEPQLPPGVKTSNLSDSSVTSSLCQTKKIEPAFTNNFALPDGNFNVNLSSASSSSTCSCSTCSATSSDGE